MASSASNGSLAQKSFKLVSRDSQNVTKLKRTVFELMKKVGGQMQSLGKKDAVGFVTKVFRLCEIPFSTDDFEEIFDKINKKNGKEIGTD